MADKRSVYFISDSTGLTVSALGRSLLSQFEDLAFSCQNIPYINSVEKARQAVERINQEHAKTGVRPLVFETLVDEQIRAELEHCSALKLDVFGTFIKSLEQELELPSSHSMGRSHKLSQQSYLRRSHAVDYTLTHDDGLSPDGYTDADLVLVGVSRSGKTPTALYLAMQFSLCVANFPITEDELDRGKLPESLLKCGVPIAGLTLMPERLQTLRGQRLNQSRYASLRQCAYEISEAEALMQNKQIPIFSTTDLSVEEISTLITDYFGAKLESRYL